MYSVLCAVNRIPGSTKIGSCWVIPKAAKKLEENGIKFENI